jgi:hypothetical protein
MNRTRDHNKLTSAGYVAIGLYAFHFAMCCAVSLGLKLTHTEEAVWLIGVLGPMTVAWIKVQVELITRHY